MSAPEADEQSAITHESKAGNRQTQKAWMADFEKEMSAGQRRAEGALIAASRPHPLYVVLIGLMFSGVVCFTAYLSLPVSLAAATFFIIMSLYGLNFIERTRRVALREARRDIKRWERINKRWQADRAKKMSPSLALTDDPSDTRSAQQNVD